MTYDALGHREYCAVGVLFTVHGTLPKFCDRPKFVIFFKFATIDQVTVEQQEALRNNATERLRLVAARTGEVEDGDLETMDRMSLLDVMAKNMVV